MNASSPTDHELEVLYQRYHQLWRHVNDDHGWHAHGTAGQIEAVHMRAHRVEGTPWHDVWRTTGQASR